MASEAELYRLLAENVKDYAIFILSGDGTVQTWTAGAERLLGYRAEEIVGQYTDRFFTQEDLQKGMPQREMEQALTTGRGEDDRWHVRKDGSRFWSSGVMTPLRDESGALHGFAKIMRDRTELKRAEEALRDSESRFRSVVQSNMIGIGFWDSNGCITGANDVLLDMIGYSREEIAAGTIRWTDLTPPEYREADQRAYAQTLATGACTPYEKEWIRKDGSHIPIMIGGSHVEGDPTRGSFWVLDISDRKRTEQDLQVQSRVLESMTEGVSLSDENGRILYTNPAEDAMFGYERGELIGQSVAVQNTYPPEENARFVAEVIDHLKQHGVWFGEFDNRKKNGQPFRTYARITTLEIGGKQHFVCVQEDVTEQKKARDALQESEQRFRQLAENITDVFWMVDPHQPAMLYVSPAYETIWGRTCQSLYEQPHSFVATVHPEDRQRVVEALDRQTRGSTTAEEYRIVRPDGSIRWVWDRGFPIKQHDGRILRVAGIAEDITARKEAERALRDSEERLRLALEAGRMGVWDWNIKTNQVRWSDNLEAIHGLANGTFGGSFEAFQQLIHPADRDLVQQAITRALEERSSYDIEFRVVWQDGSVRWLTGKGTVFTEAGTPGRMLGLAMDITERKRAEQNSRFLADASAALAAVVDYESTLRTVANLAVPFFADWCAVDMAETDGSLRRLTTVHVNPAQLRLAEELHRRFPLDPAASHGPAHVLRTSRPELTEEVTDEFLLASAKNEEHLSLLRKLRFHSYISVPLTARDKNFGVITFATAESKRHYTEADLKLAQDLAHRAAVAVDNALLYGELKRTDRRKDEFLATLAHELRNPLAPIRTGLEVVKLTKDDPATILEIHNVMERQVQQLITLVDDLLDVSRITQGKFQLRKCPVALMKVVQSAVEAARPLIDEAHHELIVHLPDSSLHLDADPHRLAQVISNLLNNAVKYTPNGGRIWLSAERQGTDVMLSVKDTGIGIPADKLASVFEMFTQIDRPVEKGYVGLGIGLTLVKSLVELHGGEVDVRSGGLNLGSEFRVRLPLIEPPTPSAAIDSAAPEPLAEFPGQKILIVDDNKAAADMLSIIVKMLGHKIRVASDGQQAVEVAAEFRPDVVLMDLGMPRMNGYDAARRIREQPWGRGVVLVALTGWGQDEDRRRTKEAGFDYHLVKPAEPADLQRLLSQARASVPPASEGSAAPTDGGLDAGKAAT